MNTGAVSPRASRARARGGDPFLRRGGFSVMNTRERLSKRGMMERMRRVPLDDGRKSMMVDLEAMTDEEYEAYCSYCDSRSSAEFRFQREACGIELMELSEELGVRLDTVKRWENPRKKTPPSFRAWAYVDSAYSDLMAAVDAAIGKVEETHEAAGEQVPVRIAYRRGAMRTRDGSTVGRANALARAVAISLVVLGYDVGVEWADEGAAGVASGAK